MKVVKENDVKIYEKFKELVNDDLSVDWLQKIFQYYQADRKEKMQDYTPKSLADFMGKLAGESDCLVDMCAGSGALTIQKWNRNPNQKFDLYEFDENVIPFLLFNLAIRNIESVVIHCDILSSQVFNTYKVFKGEKFGTVKEVKNENVVDF
ncbi:N-6 DNA methylase [Eubacterium sp.]|uniref:N-6 DNA methylase n=1 Tax=Eubacterium sp. TaxID=142586 RepID=UPI0035203C72